MTDRSEPDAVRVISRRAEYSAVAAQLVALGWSQVATDEWRGPDVTAWFETDTESRLTTLSVVGDVPEGWDDDLDLMTTAEAALLIGSEDKVEALAGLGAARILAAPELKDAVTLRLLDPDIDIGSEAAMAISEIVSQQRRAAPL